jgi:hemerythrin-like domain-containing protein
MVPLKIERGLIDQMIKLARDETLKIATKDGFNTAFIDTLVDFLRTYADKTHHGKEEDILFRELKDKDLSAEDRRLMDELAEAKDKVLQDDQEALETVVRKPAGDCVDPDSLSSTRNTSGRRTTSSSRPRWRTSLPPSRRP